MPCVFLGWCGGHNSIQVRGAGGSTGWARATPAGRGRGGIARIIETTGMFRNIVRADLSELDRDAATPSGRICRPARPTDTCHNGCRHAIPLAEATSQGRPPSRPVDGSQTTGSCVRTGAVLRHPRLDVATRPKPGGHALVSGSRLVPEEIVYARQIDAHRHGLLRQGPEFVAELLLLSPIGLRMDRRRRGGKTRDADRQLPFPNPALGSSSRLASKTFPGTGRSGRPTGRSATTSSRCWSRRWSSRSALATVPTGRPVGSMSAPRRGGAATTREREHAQPTKEIWLWCVRKDWGRVLNQNQPQ